MRLGISGKGGAGKTTVSATLAREFAARGYPVVAIDCDSDPNLAIGLGVAAEEIDAMRPLLDQTGVRRQLPRGLGPLALLEQYAAVAPGGVQVLLGARAERAGSG